MKEIAKLKILTVFSHLLLGTLYLNLYSLFEALYKVLCRNGTNSQLMASNWFVSLSRYASFIQEQLPFECNDFFCSFVHNSLEDYFLASIVLKAAFLRD